MDISEQVLVSTLAQIAQKDMSDANKKHREDHKSMEVVRSEEAAPREKIDILYELEHKIIEILLLYGNKTEEFEDVLLKVNDEGEAETITEKKDYKVFQRIFLNLQEDEVELANPLFRGIYNNLIAYYNENEVSGLKIISAAPSGLHS